LHLIASDHVLLIDDCPRITRPRLDRPDRPWDAGIGVVIEKSFPSAAAQSWISMLAERVTGAHRLRQGMVLTYRPELVGSTGRPVAPVRKPAVRTKRDDTVLKHAVSRFQPHAPGAGNASRRRIQRCLAQLQHRIRA
jgi:hypothetical protein